MHICGTRGRWVNLLWPSDAIWWHIFGSTLVQVMACCLTAPSHYLNQHWLIISEVLWHAPERKFTAIDQVDILYNELENYNFKIIATIRRGQWVNPLRSRQRTDISQVLFSNKFSVKITVFWFKFHWNLFAGVQLTLSQHWFRKRLGTKWETSHYQNQWWPTFWHICITQPPWVNSLSLKQHDQILLTKFPQKKILNKYHWIIFFLNFTNKKVSTS